MKYQKFAQVYGLELEGKIVYVGVTQRDLRQRISKHYQCSAYNRRGSKKLGEWLKSDPKFNVRLIELCPVETRFERENFWISHYDTINNGLNSEPFVDAPGREKGCSNPSGKDHYSFGKVPVAAVKASVAARSGKKLTEEHRKKIGDAQRGKPKIKRN